MNNREDLYNKIRAIINTNRKNNKLMAKIGEYLKIRIPMLKIISLFSGDYLELNTSELYHMADALEKFASDEENKVVFDMDSYFTKLEKDEANLYSVQQNTVLNKEYTEIPRVQKLKDDEYIVINMTYGEIIRNYIDTGKAVYNFDSQREPTIVNTGMGYVEIPTIFPKAIDEMVDLMVKRKFYGNVITWNILQTGKEEFDYDGQFIRIMNGTLHIVDGYNRTLAIRKALSIDPTLENEIMQVKIYNYDLPRVLEFVLQETKGNEFSAERKLSLEDNNFNKTVDFLNADSRSLLLGKITKAKDEVYKIHSKYVLYSTLSMSFEKLFKDELEKVKRQSELNNIRRKIMERMNFIINYFANDFEDISKSQQAGRVFTHNHMFIFYASLINQFKNDEDWEIKTELVLIYIEEHFNEFKIKINNEVKDNKVRKEIEREFKTIIQKALEREVA
jgi:hypothetical protein